RGGRARRAAPRRPGPHQPRAGAGVRPALPRGLEPRRGRPSPGDLGRRRRRPAAPGADGAAGTPRLDARCRPNGRRRPGPPTARRGASMTPLPSPGPPDDPLARAEEALRRAPVPEGPDAATLARTLAAPRAAAHRPGPPPNPRRRTIMFATLKIAAAAAVAAAGLLAFRAEPRAEAHAEFAEATAKLRDARTLSF